MLVTPMYYRLLLRTGRLDRRFGDTVVAGLLAAMAPNHRRQ